MRSVQTFSTDTDQKPQYRPVAKASPGCTHKVFDLLSIGQSARDHTLLYGSRHGAIFPSFEVAFDEVKAGFVCYGVACANESAPLRIGFDTAACNSPYHFRSPKILGLVKPFQFI
jgi:hypothetical protein